MKLTPQELLRSANRQRLTRAGLLKIMKENERKEKMDITIRARVNEVVEDGERSPASVTVAGASGLSTLGVREIAQKALDNLYGEYDHGYLAVFNGPDHAEVEDEDNLKVKVIHYYAGE